MQYQNSPASHKLLTQDKNMCGSLISTEKSLSDIKVCLMNSISIKLHVNNPRSRSVYAKVKATRGKILKIFGPNLIKSDLWFHILKFVSQSNFSPQRTLVKL